MGYLAGVVKFLSVLCLQWRASAALKAAVNSKTINSQELKPGWVVFLAHETLVHESVENKEAFTMSPPAWQMRGSQTSARMASTKYVNAGVLALILFEKAPKAGFCSCKGDLARGAPCHVTSGEG